MAKPDCDDGWLKYAHELDAALAVADFTKGARIVLREVFAQIFGPAKLKAASVSPTKIAERAGMKREQIARALKELCDGAVLIREGEGIFRFNKDYETWLQSDGRRPSTGLPRLTQFEVSYCRHAPAVSLAYKYGLGELDRNPMVTEVDERNHLVTESVTIRLQNRNPLVTENVTNGLRADCSPPDPPNRNGRAEFETKETGEKNNIIPPPTPERGECPPYPDAEGPLDIFPGRYPMPEDQARRIFRMLWLGFGQDRVCNGFYERQQRYPFDYWVAAIRDAKRREAPVGSIGYIEKIAGGLMKKGLISPEPMDSPTMPRRPADDYVPPSDEDREDVEFMYKATEKGKGAR